MTLDPERAPGIFSRLVLAGFDDEQIAAIIPPNADALLQFARYATTTGAHPSRGRGLPPGARAGPREPAGHGRTPQALAHVPLTLADAGGRIAP